VSLEKVFEVEIGDKTYKIEMDNMAIVNFEKAVNMGFIDWARKIGLVVDEGNGTWMPPYLDALKLLICVLRKHQPRTRFTVESLTKYVGPKDIYGKHKTGLNLLACFTAVIADDEDTEAIKDDSAEAGEDDPLAEKPRDGGT
jgi:hypothetical protein